MGFGDVVILELLKDQNKLPELKSELDCYLLPFDNIQNDPAVEWIAAGLSDMAREEMKNVYGVRIKTKEDLEMEE